MLALGLVLAALAAAPPDGGARAAAPTEGFQGARWGMSFREVLSQFPSPRTSLVDPLFPADYTGHIALLPRKVVVAGVEVELACDFVDGGLTDVTATRVWPPAEAAAALAAYDGWQATVAMEHGKPRDATTGKPGRGAARADAVQRKRAALGARWMTKQSIITLSMKEQSGPDAPPGSIALTLVSTLRPPP